MTLHHTYYQKKRDHPIILQRDGPDCFYCLLPIKYEEDREYDHLDNIDSHNYPENFVFCHHACNVKKRTYQPWQDKAIGKLRRNQAQSFLACENRQADTGTTKEITSQQEINRINTGITKQFIQEHTLTDKEVILKDAVNAIVALCQDNNGTGSQSAIYRYIDFLTNPYTGKYTISTNSQGKNIIRRRNEN